MTDETTSTSDTSTPANSYDHVLADLEDESSSEDEDAIDIVPGTQSPVQSDVVASSSQTLDSAGASSSSLDPAEQNLIIWILKSMFYNIQLQEFITTIHMRISSGIRRVAFKRVIRFLMP